MKGCRQVSIQDGGTIGDEEGGKRRNVGESEKGRAEDEEECDFRNVILAENMR